MRIFKYLIHLFITLILFTQSTWAYFYDLHELHDNYLAINYLEEIGIVNGYLDGSFKPDLRVNRAEFLALTLKGSEIPIDAPPQSIPFNDIATDSWYHPVVQKAYSKGWINGYDDGSFRPNYPINKAEAIKIIGMVQNWNVTADSSVWYLPFFDYASEQNLTPSNYLPEDYMTRADTSEVIYRNIAIQEGLPIQDDPYSNVLINTGFTAQAPFGEWSDPRQAEACEEAAVYMAVKWARNESYSLEQAKADILNISHFQTNKYWTYHDTSVKDTYDWIVKDYFNFQNATYHENITLKDIYDELMKGNLVVVNVNGQKTPNPFFTAPGPLQHAILIKGYDSSTQEFITNDPGTRHGESFRYTASDLNLALHDYETGELDFLPPQEKNMIVIGKE